MPMIWNEHETATESVDLTKSPIQLWFNTTAFSDQYRKARILLLHFHVVVLDEISRREKINGPDRIPFKAQLAKIVSQ